MQYSKPLILCALMALAACSSGKKEQAALQEPQTGTQPLLANARQSTAWQGTYQGILPCANCEGIAIMLVLEPNGQYVMRTRMLGIDDKDRKYEGTYDWQGDSMVRLSGETQQKVFAVHDGYIIARMPDGTAIPAHPGADYRLEKTQ